MSNNDRPIIKTTEEARQGREMHMTRYVLAISLTAAIVIVGGITLFFQFVR